MNAASPRVIAPVMQRKEPWIYPHVPRPIDSPAVAVWRTRKCDAAIKAICHLSATTAECINAHFRNRGLRTLTDCFLDKSQACAIWQALAHNLRRAAVLRVSAGA